MKIKDVELKNFRNHTKQTFEFADETTVIFGANGSGKSNILESVYLLSTGRSTRTKYDKDLISHFKDNSSVKGHISNLGDDYTIEVRIHGKEDTNVTSKKLKINSVEKPLSALSQVFSCVLFTPEDIDILTGTPAVRRKYIDLLLSQLNIKYKKSLYTYTKAVRQRNKILEMISLEGKGLDQIGFWTDVVLKEGVFIQQERQRNFEILESVLRNEGRNLKIYKESVTLEYKKNEISPQRLEKHREHEIYAKTTLVGPHRDDFSILVDGYNSAEFSSRGQQRGIILCLKLGEIKLLSDTLLERPVLLLDDIFSELDESHQRKVYDIIDKQQTIITSAEQRSFESQSAPKTINI